MDENTINPNIDEFNIEFNSKILKDPKLLELIEQFEKCFSNKLENDYKKYSFDKINFNKNKTWSI